MPPRAPLPAWATTKKYDWYVDSINGSDANSGKSASAAKATIGAITIAAGQKIGLACGSTWREQLTIAADNVSVLAYGAGNKPILDCADAVAAGSWTKSGGLTNVYQTTVSPALAVADTRVQMLEDTTRLIHATSTANCDATPGSYYPSSETTAPITLYVHASDNSNPANSGKVYSFSARQCGIDCFAATGTVISGIETRNNLHDAGSLRLGRYSRVYNCIARNGSKHNIYVKTGSYLENVQAIEAYYDSSANMIVINEDTPNNEGVTLVNCAATLSALPTNIGGLYGHYNTSGSFGTITLTNFTATKVNTAASFLAGAATFVFNNLTITGCKYGVSATIDTTINGGAIDTTDFCAAPGAGVTLIIDNVSMDVTGSQAIAVNYNNATVRLTNSRIGLTKIPNYGIISNTATPTTFYSHGNTFGACAQQNYYFASGLTVTLDSDYNTFSTTRAQFRVGGPNYTTLALYQAGASQDAHSVVA